MSHFQRTETKLWVGRVVRLTASNVRDHITGKLVPVWTRGTIRQVSYNQATAREILLVAWDCGVTCPVHVEDIEVLAPEERDGM